MFESIHRQFRDALRLPPTPGADSWHVNTRQPNEDTAQRFALAHFGLTFVNWAPGSVARYDFARYTPADFHLRQLPAAMGLGGVVVGEQRMTALLISQADAIARGLTVRPNG